MRKNQITDTLEKGLIWLSASDPEVLKNKCPKWEKIKYEAFGASVLVPVFFGMIASAYAVSTLTTNWFFIGMFSLVWGFIILTIDRVLLSTYRAFVSASKKWIQFCLRISVAVLMGLTVSHPLTLLLFKDTISSEIEKERTNEMLAMRDKTEGNKTALEERIRTVSAELAAHQKKYQETVSGDFLNQPVVQEAPRSNPVTDARFADIDAQIDSYKDERATVRRDLERWQATYDEEVRGIRSGKSGVGPNARAIERDHLAWRRDEVQRLNGMIKNLTDQRAKLSSELMARSMEVSASLEASRRMLEKQKLDVFANQQGQLLEVIKSQIDSTSAELAMLRKDASQLALDTSDRVAHLKVEKRSDLMAQTETLHKMFKNPDGGGTFALAVYIVLVALFTLIDTIPLVVKFCSVPGLYDKHLYYKENSVRAIGINEAIDDKFSTAMKKRDDILHELLHYNPLSDSEKRAIAAAEPETHLIAETSEVIEASEVIEEDENFVDISDQQIEAIESFEIISPESRDNVSHREVRGNVRKSPNGSDPIISATVPAGAVKVSGMISPSGAKPLNGAANDENIEAEKAAEALRVAEEEKAAEALRVDEEQKVAEAHRIAEEQKAAEALRVAEEQKAAEALRIAEEQKAAEAHRVAEEQKAAEARRIAELRQDASPVSPIEVGEDEEYAAVYKDEPTMLEPGFGAALLSKNEGDADFSAEIEIPVTTNSESKRPTYSQQNFRNNWAAHQAAGGVALQPNDLSDKAR